MTTVAVIGNEDLAAWVRRASCGALELGELAAASVVVADAALVGSIESAAPIVAVGDPTVPAPEHVAHVVRRGLAELDLGSLLVALATGAPTAAEELPPPADPDAARAAQVAFAMARRLAGASDLFMTEAIAIDAVLELLDADRAHCLFYDGDDRSVWSEAKQRGVAGDDRRAVAGLVGFAAATGMSVRATAAMDDPRYVSALDDPEGEPDAHIIVQPVIGTDAVVHAVVVAVRRSRRSDFSAADAVLLARFAMLAAPLFEQLSVHLAAQAILDDEIPDRDLFRPEALEAARAPQWGDVIRVTPGWLGSAYWVLVAILAASAAFVVFGQVSTWSSGPAIIRSTARGTVAARAAGTITEVLASPGDRVEADTVIARLDDTVQRATADWIEREFETQLRNHLLDPGDASISAVLANLRPRLETARDALAERQIRAGGRGHVGDLHVRAGQHVEAGGIIGSVVKDGGGLEVIALLSGEDRPQLAPGMSLRLELRGYRHAYQTVQVESVSLDVIGPTEALRVLGVGPTDNLTVSGPVVVVRGRLPNEFEVDGERYEHHDGMLGTAQIAVRRERILFAVMPGTRRLQ